jgi:hypothetical protein
MDAALEYHLNHRLAVDFAPKPPIERSRANQRERFENGSRWPRNAAREGECS